MERAEREVERVARRPYWRDAEARVIVDAWRRSGESQRAFASRYGVDVKRVGRWAVRLNGAPARSRTGESGGSREPAATGVRFHPVQVRAAVERAAVVALPTVPQAETVPALEVVLGDGRTVRVRRGFAPEDLHQVLVVLEALSEPGRGAGRAAPRGRGDGPC